MCEIFIYTDIYIYLICLAFFIFSQIHTQSLNELYTVVGFLNLLVMFFFFCEIIQLMKRETEKVSQWFFLTQEKAGLPSRPKRTVEQHEVYDGLKDL